MRIGIDARFFGPIGKGLGRYTQKLVENLEKIDSENEYFVFLRKENFNEYNPVKKNFKKVLADFKWYSFEEQLKFPKLLKKHNLDLMHFTHFNIPILYRGKFIATIHDLILLHFPTIKNSRLNPIFYRLKFMAYRMVIKHAIKRSNRIITVSNFTKTDIIKNFKRIPEEKLIVTYEAAEDYCMLSPDKDDEILSRYGIMKPYIMYVGNAYPHKNLEKLAEGFAVALSKYSGLHLVLVGKDDFFYSRLRNFIKNKNIHNVIFVGYVPDHELDTLFHNASAFVWPSLYEGFGLPPLEAMSKGIPVISSDHPCMREVLADSVYYFNGKKVSAIADAIEKILSDNSLREKLIKKGYFQVNKYSWKNMANKTLEAYGDIFNKTK